MSEKIYGPEVLAAAAKKSLLAANAYRVSMNKRAVAMLAVDLRTIPPGYTTVAPIPGLEEAAIEARIILCYPTVDVPQPDGSLVPMRFTMVVEDTSITDDELSDAIYEAHVEKTLERFGLARYAAEAAREADEREKL
jgi:hypothetical protein